MLEVRRCETREELLDAIAAIGSYFGMERNAERAERFAQNLPVERMHAAHEDGLIVGGAGAFPFELTVPGGTVACSGITAVGVYPTHRRRGALRAMMRAQLDDAHERGDPVALLFSSEETIYGRFGYGLASWTGEISLAREYTSFAAPFEPLRRTRFVDPEEALELFPPVYDAVRLERPGMYGRTRTWWEVRVLRRSDSEPHPKRLVALERDGATVGYAIYRTEPNWAEGVSNSTLQVVEALGVDPGAVASIWRFLLDIDWVARVEASLLPPDHPLFLLLAMPRRARYRRGDGLWLRLVDVGAALRARTYGGGEDAVVVEVRDPFCPWNEGRWRIARREVGQTDEQPDLRLGVDALASAYLGGITFRELADALRVEELTDSAVARADGLFRAPLHPWCPEIF